MSKSEIFAKYCNMKTILGDRQRLTLASLISLALHGLIFTLPTPKKAALNRPALEVEMLSPEKLRQYRTVGIKGGKPHFSVPVPSPLSLRSLQQATPKITTGQRPLKKGPSEGKVIAPFKTSKKTSFLRQTDLSIRFEPPEGVSEDELNDAEKTFWSFQKRVYQTYASSVLSTYQQLRLSRPQIQKALKKVNNHVIAGKMVFDEKGNIVRIKMIHPSEYDDLQTLFERSLRNINKIPNPPRGLLSERKELTLYYQLIINRR